MLLSMNEILQIDMRPLLVRLRSHKPRTTLAAEELLHNHTLSTQSPVLPARRDVLATLQKLPPVCLTRTKATRAVIAIRRGELGYYLVDPPISPEEFNKLHDITPEQVAAMENGALFGWEVPEADPDIVRAHGLALVPDAPGEATVTSEKVSEAS